MEYLREYFNSDEEFNDVLKAINDSNLDEDLFIYDKDKITKIIDLFTSIGVTNIYGIFMVNADLFGESYKYIESKVKGYDDEVELARLINEDAMNLSFINLY